MKKIGGRAVLLLTAILLSLLLSSCGVLSPLKLDSTLQEELDSRLEDGNINIHNPVEDDGKCKYHRMQLKYDSEKHYDLCYSCGAVEDPEPHERQSLPTSRGLTVFRGTVCYFETYRCIKGCNIETVYTPWFELSKK